jgi:hypothetical protein
MIYSPGKLSKKEFHHYLSTLCSEHTHHSQYMLRATSLRIQNKSPVLKSDETDSELVINLPDLLDVMDSLAKDTYVYINSSPDQYVQTVQRFFSTAIKYQLENLEVKSAQETIKRISIMKDLDNFNPTQIRLKKLSHLSTWTALLFWLLAIIAFAASVCCCCCLCPACCGPRF